MAKPMADYVKLPELEEYREWFKDFADLYREDGILQVTWKTKDGPMHHSGMSHRAISQLVRVLSLDYKNEIIIFTHIGDNWMIESDANGWETYSKLPKERFQHQYFDDTNLIKKEICCSTAIKGGLMRKSNNKKTRDVTAFIYLRLSRDDNLDGESYSIGNQKKLLTKTAKDLGYSNIVTFIDDGVSGVTMNRPGFNDMMQQLEENRAAGLFERIYEDNLSGKLSDERFAKMSQRYEAEQAELAEKMKLLRHEIDKLSSNSVSTDLFLSTVRKYTRSKKLTPRMLNELINRIEVHQAEKINGEWVQRLTIHYNCIGALFIPDTEPLPAPNVTVNTRRGVYVTYEPAQNE